MGVRSPPLSLLLIGPAPFDTRSTVAVRIETPRTTHVKINTTYAYVYLVYTLQNQILIIFIRYVSPHRSSGWSWNIRPDAKLTQIFMETLVENVAGKQVAGEIYESLKGR